MYIDDDHETFSDIDLHNFFGSPNDHLICPKCRCIMTVKNGQFGSFFGCSNFPICNCTLPYNATHFKEEQWNQF